VPAPAGHDPAAEVGGQSIEVVPQAVRGDDRRAARRQGGAEGMDEAMGRLLGAWARAPAQG
jgi:hypothetical protein